MTWLLCVQSAFGPIEDRYKQPALRVRDDDHHKALAMGKLAQRLVGNYQTGDPVRAASHFAVSACLDLCCGACAGWRSAFPSDHYDCDPVRACRHLVGFPHLKFGWRKCRCACCPFSNSPRPRHAVDGCNA